MGRRNRQRARGAIERRELKQLQDFFLLWANYCRAMRQDEPLKTKGKRALEVNYTLSNGCIVPAMTMNRLVDALLNCRCTARNLSFTHSNSRSVFHACQAVRRIARSVSPERSRGSSAALHLSRALDESEDDDTDEVQNLLACRVARDVCNFASVSPPPCS